MTDTWIIQYKYSNGLTVHREITIAKGIVPFRRAPVPPKAEDIVSITMTKKDVPSLSTLPSEAPHYGAVA